MKKFLSIALVVLMMLACAVTVSAATMVVTGESSATINITAKKSSATYHVLLQWDSLDFVYTPGGWNEKTHTYDDKAGSWDKTSATINVENHSNSGVTVEAELSNSNAVNGVSVALNKTSVELASADNDLYRGVDAAKSALDGTYNAGPKDSFVVSITGTPTNISSTNDVTVSTLTITIRATEPTP